MRFQVTSTRIATGQPLNGRVSAANETELYQKAKKAGVQIHTVVALDDAESGDKKNEKAQSQKPAGNRSNAASAKLASRVLGSIIALVIVGCLFYFISTGKNSNLTPPSDQLTSPSPSGIQNSGNAQEKKRQIEKSIIDIESAISGLNQSIQKREQNIERYRERIASWRAKQARGMKTADDVGIGEAIDLGNIGKAFDSVDTRIKSLEESIAEERKQIDITRWELQNAGNNLTSLRKQLIDIQ
jgi:hypothetical protein